MKNRDNLNSNSNNRDNSDSKSYTKGETFKKMFETYEICGLKLISFYENKDSLLVYGHKGRNVCCYIIQKTSENEIHCVSHKKHTSANLILKLKNARKMQIDVRAMVKCISTMICL